MAGIHPKFNFTGGEVNQSIESLKEQSKKMVWNSHPTPGIFTIADENVTDLNIFNNYGHLVSSDITVHATTYVNADTI